MLIHGPRAVATPRILSILLPLLLLHLSFASPCRGDSSRGSNFLRDYFLGPPGPPPFVWDPSDASEGVSIRLEIGEPFELSGMKGLAGELQVFASGFPEGEELTFWLRQMSPMAAEGVIYSRLPARVGPDNLVRFTGQNSEGIVLGGFARGQAVDVALVSNVTAARAHAKGYLSPIEARSSDGCGVTVELVSPNARAFAVHLEGFRPGEGIRVTHQLGKRSQTQTGAASGKGTRRFELRFRLGTQGPVHLTASGEACEVAVDFGVGRLDSI